LELSSKVKFTEYDIDLPQMKGENSRKKQMTRKVERDNQKYREEESDEDDDK
jgi:hypothetical protein